MTTAGVQEADRWYALQTKSKQELRAEANLRSWGIQVLFPRVSKLGGSRRSNVLRCVEPLFPNYIFARFDAKSMLSKVQLTRGVRRVVGLGEHATPVDDAAIALIQSQVDDSGIVRPEHLQRGDVVEITAGPLRSLVGVFERQSSARDRVRILLTILGCAAWVEVGSETIQKRGH